MVFYHFLQILRIIDLITFHPSDFTSQLVQIQVLRGHGDTSCRVPQQGRLFEDWVQGSVSEEILEKFQNFTSQKWTQVGSIS